MKTLSPSDPAAMPIDRRIRSGKDLRDSIAESPEEVEIPAWHKTELEKRLREYDLNPDEGSPWLEVEKRIIG